MGSSQMTARTLDIAILEAIQAHADRYTHGIVSMEAALSALGVVTADFLAQIRDQRQCSERKFALFPALPSPPALSGCSSLQIPQQVNELRPPDPMRSGHGRKRPNQSGRSRK